MSERDVGPEDGVVSFFTADHRRCDERWVEVEAGANAHDAAKAASAWAAFDRAMRRHFEMEESVLFPAFERATGMTGGPTMVMRMEHQQMRALLDQMSAAAARGQWDEVVDQGDTLLMLIQQHNTKEEAILYPMAEQHLAGSWSELVVHLKKS